MFYCYRNRLSMVKENRFAIVCFQFGFIVVGFDSQGRGKFTKINVLNINEEPFYRYNQKSLGYYLTISKNYKALGGNLGMHIGINKTFHI